VYSWDMDITTSPIPQVSPAERRELGDDAALALSAKRLAALAASSNPTQASLCPVCGAPATGETVVSGYALFHAACVPTQRPVPVATHDPGCATSSGVDCDCGQRLAACGYDVRARS